MSKIPYTINLDDYVCNELERIRKAIKTLDFSGLEATVERLQYHGEKMEEALYKQLGALNAIYAAIKRSVSDTSDEQVIDKIKAILKGVDEERYAIPTKVPDAHSQPVPESVATVDIGNLEYYTFTE